MEMRRQQELTGLNYVFIILIKMKNLKLINSTQCLTADLAWDTDSLNGSCFCDTGNWQQFDGFGGTC